MPLSFAFLLYLAASGAQPVPTVMETAQESSGSEIVVTARQLRDFRAVVKTRRKTGEPYCQLRKSSRNAAFDTELCALMVSCHISVENSTALRLVRTAGARRREVEQVVVAEAERCMAPFFEKHRLGDE